MERSEGLRNRVASDRMSGISPEKRGEEPETRVERGVREAT